MQLLQTHELRTPRQIGTAFVRVVLKTQEALDHLEYVIDIDEKIYLFAIPDWMRVRHGQVGRVRRVGILERLDTRHEVVRVHVQVRRRPFIIRRPGELANEVAVPLDTRLELGVKQGVD